MPGRDKEAQKAGEEGYEAIRATAQQYVRIRLMLVWIDLPTSLPSPSTCTVLLLKMITLYPQCKVR